MNNMKCGDCQESKNQDNGSGKAKYTKKNSDIIVTELIAFRIYLIFDSTASSLSMQSFSAPRT